MIYSVLSDLVASTSGAAQATTEAVAETTEDVTISVEEIVEQVTTDPVSFFDSLSLIHI